MDIGLAQEKVFSAISGLQDRMARDVVLRPSSCGYCIRRLWFMEKARLAGAAPEPPNPANQWMALQGTVNEVLVRQILELAGAEILHPPDREPGSSSVEFAHGTGMVPHVDGAIRWPEVGIDQWAFIECKHLRTMASIELILDTLWGDRAYLYQSIAYLMMGREVCDTMNWNIEVPTKTMFLLNPKDPSTVRMLMSGRVKQTKKELEKPQTMKPEEIVKAAKKSDYRDRLETLGDLSWYFEELDSTDPRVQAIWEEILTFPEILQQEDAPPALHNPNLPDKDQDVECAVYCDWKEECLNTTLIHDLKRSGEVGV